jgi:hypothetical protein
MAALRTKLIKVADASHVQKRILELDWIVPQTALLRPRSTSSRLLPTAVVVEALTRPVYPPACRRSRPPGEPSSAVLSTSSVPHDVRAATSTWLLAPATSTAASITMDRWVRHSRQLRRTALAFRSHEEAAKMSDYEAVEMIPTSSVCSAVVLTWASHPNVAALG